MAENWSRAAFLCGLVLYLFSRAICIEDDICVQESSCLCRFEDDRIIDLTQAVPNGTFLKDTIQSNTYIFLGCKDATLDDTKLGLDINQTLNSCTKNGNGQVKSTSVCVYNSVNKSLTDLGSAKYIKFSNDKPKSLVYQPPNENATAIILLVCDGLKETYLKAPSDENSLLLFSPHACVVREHKGLSVGSTLLILFAVFAGTYFLGGALVLNCLRGARGKEMIPNLDFWTKLPGLVRDGIIFLFNGCSATSLSSAEVYDRI